MQKIGVFVCWCGSNIAGTVDVAQVVEAVRQIPDVAYAIDYKYMCSEQGQELIRKAVADYKLDRLVVCSCSPRMHEATFRKCAEGVGINPYMVEIANIREQCSWVLKDKAEATAKAIKLAKAAIAKVRFNGALKPGESQVVKRALVIGGGIAGIQVFVVLLVGIVSGAIIMLGSGQTTPWEMLTNMGSGTSGMFETSMVAILVAAMCALIRENGGFDVLLNVIHRIFRGKRGGQFGVGLLVTLLDIATANNTVAIVMANPIAKEISEDYGISDRKTASLLDTFSCISQGILPYGAQMLVALSAVHELGYELSAFEVMPLLFYPGMLFISSLICIFLLPERGNRAKAKK